MNMHASHTYVDFFFSTQESDDAYKKKRNARNENQENIQKVVSGKDLVEHSGPVKIK